MSDEPENDHIFPAWQPIDTAPEGVWIIAFKRIDRDTTMTNILALCDCCGRYVNKSMEYVQYEPTHWMPMPHPPAGELH